MTREEYESLLQSDYWKGYSYSLIKERNFTCEDCGRSFPGERNKLQVHHLVYRDVNPWSYRPEEVIVLCKDCHEKRHGIIHEKEQEIPSYQNTTEQSSFKAYDSTVEENSEVIRSNYYDDQPVEKRNKKAYLIVLAFALCLFLAGLVSNMVDYLRERKDIQDAEMVEEATQVENTTVSEQVNITSNGTKRGTVEKNITRGTQKKVTSNTTSSEQDSFETSEAINQNTEETGNNSKETTLEILERKNHENTVRRAEEMGLSTEGTTLEVLERMNHESTVRRAKEMGVSAEGTTLEILERINHESTVRRAKEMGVSAEGTTLEILERINHENTVRRAKEMGVSTEGTTLEILERISEKQLKEHK